MHQSTAILAQVNISIQNIDHVQFLSLLFS